MRRRQSSAFWREELTTVITTVHHSHAHYYDYTPSARDQPDVYRSLVACAIGTLCAISSIQQYAADEAIISGALSANGSIVGGQRVERAREQGGDVKSPHSFMPRTGIIRQHTEYPRSLRPLILLRHFTTLSLRAQKRRETRTEDIGSLLDGLRRILVLESSRLEISAYYAKTLAELSHRAAKQQRGLVTQLD